MDIQLIAMPKAGKEKSRRPWPQQQLGAGALAALAGVFCVAPAAAQSSACSGGTYLLCDDFDGPSIDTAKWTVAKLDIANTYPVRPQNIRLTTLDDQGKTITVVDAQSFGDQHPKPRQGGVLISNQRYGGGRYEVRMKNLPGPHGCSCFWNYYDSENEVDPPPERVYTEIDIEMPAHMASPPAWEQWRHILGFNTWSHTDRDADATYINHSSTLNPFDGRFHVYRWDWRDGSNGKRRINWYMDGVLQASTTRHVSNAAAQLWVGTWPAPWAGMDYNFKVKHLYIDWVRISALP
jgi:Glycosyl hydrolases family 16